LAAFGGVLVIMALWEVASPMRRLSAGRSYRWPSNLGLVAFNSFALRTILPLTAAGTAAMAAEQGWGLFHYLSWSDWVSGLITIILLDLAVYLQHVLFHAVPILWRLHMVHHTDPDIDCTTGLRFHTLEIIVSMGIKILVVGLLGPPVWSVIAFEIILNGTAVFNHSNVRLPGSIDHLLRRIVVTPDMHRVHHSVLPVETNSNFGFNLPWWDWIFGTYCAQPFMGHQRMTIGLKAFQDARSVRLHWMMAFPFIRQDSNDAVLRRRQR
jgi:sterol desaturase/sphingolipid hydroxylase (fatty acid hydroxylase superfamily)